MGEPLIKWSRPKGEYLRSDDSRFRVVPIFRSTVKPDGYWLEDRSKKLPKVGRLPGGYARSSFETVKRAKEHAEWLVREERGLNPPGPAITPEML